jgi:hypothetical protein
MDYQLSESSEAKATTSFIWIIYSAFVPRQVLSGLPAPRIIGSLFQQGAEHKALISALLEDQED